jgi:hypothetical protein
MLDYNTAILTTQNPIFISMVIISWLLPILLFTLLAVFITKKTSGGSHLRPIFSSGSYVIALIIWGVLGLLLNALLIFPIFLRLSWLSYIFP